MKNKKVPMRTCVGCRTSKPKNELIRMVNNNGKLLVDKVGKANGRGIYLCKSGECFEKAIKKKAIERSLGISVDENDMAQLNKEVTGGTNESK